jgi:shikimate kinase
MGRAVFPGHESSFDSLMMPSRPNIVLIGMPGSGKSTVGVLLAERLGYGFMDTDIAIQTGWGRRLQEIIDSEGPERFRVVEERAVLDLTLSAHVIATGGSVVYSEKAMQHLRKNGTICHLEAAPERLLQRIDNLDSRGILLTQGRTFAGLYAERRPLYLKYADITVAVDALRPDQVVRQILSLLADRLEEGSREPPHGPNTDEF